MSLVMVELYRARVHIAILSLPGVQFGLKSLVLDTVKLEIL